MQTTTLVDSHAHCYVEDMKSSKADWIQRLQNANVSHVLLPNIDTTTIDSMNKLCEEYPHIFIPMIGLHPCDVKENASSDLKIIKAELDTNPAKYCGVGEIGLDYHWDSSTKVLQIKALKTQFEWAIEYNKPVSIHSRKSNHDMIPLLAQYSKKGLKGVMHCFSGSIEEAKQIVETGFFLGIGGVLTFANSGLAEVMKEVDLDSIVLETDSPYLAPSPHRGKQNEPSYTAIIAEKLAEIKGISFNEVAIKTSKNAINLYNLNQFSL